MEVAAFSISQREALFEPLVVDPLQPVTDTLEIKIQHAISNPNDLQALLPEIVASRDRHKLICQTYTDIAWNGHIDSFYIISPVFATYSDLFDAETAKRLAYASSSYAAMYHQRNTIYHDALVVGFLHASCQNNLDIAQKIFDVVWKPSYGLAYDTAVGHTPGKMREMTLVAILNEEIMASRVSITKRVLDMDFSIRDLQSFLSGAALTENRAIIPTLYEMLMKEKKRDTELILMSTLRAEDERHPLVQEKLMLQRAEAFEMALREAINHSWEDIISLLLPEYVRCIVSTTDRRLLKVEEALANASGEHYALVFSRAESLRLLEKDLPRIVRCGLSFRLRLNEHSASEDALVIRCCGREINAHRDVLRYWSKYFDGLSRHDWVDRSIVDFGDHVEPDVMRILLDFMYSGELAVEDVIRKGGDFVGHMWEAADYLMIKALQGWRTLSAKY